MAVFLVRLHQCCSCVLVSPGQDTAPGFLARVLKELITQRPSITEHTMDNYLQLGYRQRDRGPMIIQQVGIMFVECDR